LSKRYIIQRIYRKPDMCQNNICWSKHLQLQQILFKERCKLPKKTKDWMEIITTCRRSGLTDRQWCLENGIPTSTFYYHQNRIRQETCSLPASSMKNTAPVIQDIVQLKVKDEQYPQPPGISPGITLDIHGIKIEIANRADPIIITATLQTLVNIC